MMNRKTLLVLVLVLFQAAGCATNAVTGKRNFQIYGSDWEQQVGAQMYSPMKQSQGGDYVVDRELTEYVQQVGNRLANQARRKGELDYQFSIINSSVPNAWALPGGKIVVNRGLLTELDSEAELAAVLGHEIVHADAAHGARQQSTGMLAQIGAVASMVILGSKIDNRAAQEVAMLIPTVGAQLIMQKYGRDAERESDEYGMLYMSEAGYDPQGAIELQETFVKLSEGRSSDWLSGLFASHPPSTERLENNRKSAAELPKKGEMGRERYKQKLAYLRRVEPAYAAYDEALKAVSEEKLDLAQQKLSQAKRIEPREPLFMTLQGDLYRLKDDLGKASRSYDQAIEANDGFFYPYLRKGQVEYDRKDWSNARPALQSSLKLLPTAEAHYLLGLLDRKDGNEQQALAHFAEAAKSNSEAGKSAQKEMIIVDLPKSPSKYIASQAAMDGSNTVWVQFANRTQVPIKNIVLNIAWLDDQGQTRQARRSYRGPLAAGKQDQIKLNLKFRNQQELSSRIRVEVSAAEIAE